MSKVFLQLPVLPRRAAYAFFKLTVEIRQILEAAGKGNFHGGTAGAAQHVTGTLYPKLYDIFHRTDSDHLLKAVHEMAPA